MAFVGTQVAEFKDARMHRITHPYNVECRRRRVYIPHIFDKYVGIK